MKNTVNRAQNGQRKTFFSLVAKKNKILVAAMLVVASMFSIHVSAQLKVGSNGNVSVHNPGTTDALSYLSIGGTGLSNAKLYVYGTGSAGGDQYGVYSYLSWGMVANWKYAVYGLSKATGGNMVGVKGEASPINNSSSTATYGVYGLAGGANSGKNYGVFGLLQSGSYNGTGVYGSNSTTVPTISARYAGYFYGNTYVNGHLSYTSSSQTSDARLKTNISDIKTDALLKIKELHPVQFQWQQVEDISIEDSVIVKTPHFSEDVDFNQQHYGFLAQEVQKIFPDIVLEGSDGYLSVNYTELIPLLIQAVQELSTEMEELKKQNK